jgi:hypothetical protein
LMPCIGTIYQRKKFNCFFLQTLAHGILYSLLNSFVHPVKSTLWKAMPYLTGQTGKLLKVSRMLLYKQAIR